MSAPDIIARGKSNTSRRQLKVVTWASLAGWLAGWVAGWLAASVDRTSLLHSPAELHFALIYIPPYIRTYIHTHIYTYIDRLKTPLYITGSYLNLHIFSRKKVYSNRKKEHIHTK